MERSINGGFLSENDTLVNSYGYFEEDYVDKKTKKKPIGKVFKKAGQLSLQNNPAAIAGRVAKGGKPIKLKPQSVSKTLKQSGRGAAIGAGLVGGGMLAKAASPVTQKIAQASKQRIAEKTGLQGKELNAVTKEALKVTKNEKKRKGNRGKKQKASSVVKKTSLNATLLSLVPLEKTMREGLAQQGIKAPADLSDVANLYYNEVVQKSKNNWDNYPSIDLNNFDEDNVDSVSDAVVSGILTYIAKSREKKKSGQALTKAEEIIVSGSEKVEDEIRTQAKDEASMQVGKSLLFNKKVQIGIGLFIAFLLYLAFKN